jgi:hypothetical protein
MGIEKFKKLSFFGHQLGEHGGSLDKRRAECNRGEIFAKEDVTERGW